MLRSHQVRRRRGGWFQKNCFEFERTTPSAPLIGTGIFLDGASTPPLPRRGVYSAQAFSKIKCVYFTGLYARVPHSSPCAPSSEQPLAALLRAALEPFCQ